MSCRFTAEYGGLREHLPYPNLKPYHIIHSHANLIEISQAFNGDSLKQDDIMSLICKVNNCNEHMKRTAIATKDKEEQRFYDQEMQADQLLLTSLVTYQAALKVIHTVKNKD